MQRQTPADPLTPPRKADARKDVDRGETAAEREERLLGAANNDVESGRNGARTADETRQSPV